MTDIAMTSTAPSPTISGQLDRLVSLGVHRLAGLSADELRGLAPGERDDQPRGLLVVHPSLVGPTRLAPLLARGGKRGFVVEDMDDLDAFEPIDGIVLPDQALYIIRDVDRGDDLRNASPDEALPRLRARGRRPLTVNEGISYLLQEPDRLEPGRCFMTIGSRRRGPKGLDARTPAIWISGGTGRDGTARRGAPKVGWCWAGNRHTWLGFASTMASSVER